MNKPFAPACERNAEPILARLRAVLPQRCSLLEIGSGTGQHAVHFMRAEPGWQWQCSEQLEQLPGLQLWLDELPDGRTPAPWSLDVCQPRWPSGSFDAVFSANTLHIMPWPAVEALFRRLPEVLRPGGELLIYGPFNVDGRYSSPSNAEFDALLKSRSPSQGIRDIADVNALAKSQGIEMIDNFEMPANNRLIHWQRMA